MSLYDHEEICRDCKHAVWIKGEKRTAFDYCKLSADDKVSHIDGTCTDREVRGSTEEA